MGIMAAGLFLLSRLEVDTPNSYIIMAMAVTGFGSGLFQTPNNSAVMSSVPADSRGVASGMLATARNIGMVIGVGLSSTLFMLFAGQAPSQAAEGLAGLIAQKASFIYALRLTFIVASFVAVAAMAASLTKGKASLPAMFKKVE
jgi:MFS family permease